ncbi:hypothetical protein G9F32_12220 [Acinetobacter sp. 194]|uniref:hypothetical protein n=1 Tax=Acinetobacter shaoyimingii TaxID=2715164 RepID=UPI00140DC70D|nr:hypothetical protein [Acinetobacter shaoyimingii]NHB58774.1 hypothetical protein [Acinetobacter shaoyimingii]
MFTLRQEKLFELDQAQNQEFLHDLVYEIIKENPALKLNGQFNELVKPVQKLIDKYLKKGINQINTLKYMVKSHVYLGIDYDEDSQFDWIKLEMENYNISDQITYVDAFYNLLEDYKTKVIGIDLIFFIEAVKNFKNGLGDIYPQKIIFLKSKGLYKSKNSIEEFILGKNYKNNCFIKNIIKLEN